MGVESLYRGDFLKGNFSVSEYIVYRKCTYDTLTHKLKTRNEVIQFTRDKLNMNFLWFFFFIGDITFFFCFITKCEKEGKFSF